ncbi:nuclear transport factor 2 family protein [Streptomyces sp. Ac-502]|uniref:nuclear transport factor 2 family protein n=1 Tax=Streptomyces sp. Ac-502 TaxID=3342801 RepID=UPI003862B31C
MRFFAEGFPRLFARDVIVTFHRFHAAGERGVEATMTATLANGNHYGNDYCFVLELQGELIHRVREYTDTARGHRMAFGEVRQQPSPARARLRVDSRIHVAQLPCPGPFTG